MAHRMNRKSSGLGFNRRNEKERILFIAAAGLAVSLLIVMLVVLNSRSVGAKQLPAPQEQVVEPASVGTITLFALERPASAGTSLAEIEVKEMVWQRGSVPPGAVLDVTEIRDQFAKVYIPAGAPITRDQLTTEKKEASLPVRPGYRAVSIEVDATSSLEGHARPGTRVDVLLTYYKDDELTTKVIVQNVMVLSLGGDTEAEKGRNNRRPQTSKTITLEVTAADSLKMQTARQLGRLSLAMRASEDHLTVPKTEMQANEIDDTKRKEPEVKDCGGRVRMHGKEYVVNCDGSITALMEYGE